MPCSVLDFALVISRLGILSWKRGYSSNVETNANSVDVGKHKYSVQVGGSWDHIM